MKKGFTLIELLAVIVILAVLALIATPIVLNIIDDSKKNATLRSSENYIKAIEFSIAKSVMENKRLNDGTYNVMSNGNICLGTLTNSTCDNELVVEVSGETPESGTVTIKSRKIDSYEFTYASGFVVINGEINSEDTEKVCKLINGPANEIGSKYECEVKEGTKFNFYVLSHDDDGTTNLIMDRNICDDGTAATEDNLCETPWNSSGLVKDGPTTVIDYLNLATTSWKNISTLDITIVNSEEEDLDNFFTYKLTGKARLPYLDELSNYDPLKNNAYLFDNLTLECCLGETCADPMFCSSGDNEWPVFGVDVSGISHIIAIQGYWSINAGGAGDSEAYAINYEGNVDRYDVTNSFGVRPVINIKL